MRENVQNSYYLHIYFLLFSYLRQAFNSAKLLLNNVNSSKKYRNVHEANISQYRITVNNDFYNDTANLYLKGTSKQKSTELFPQ